MKTPLLFALSAALVGCSTTTDTDPAHAAVTAYVKKDLGEPGSYESARWGKPAPFFRGDSANLAAMKLMKSNIRQEREKGYKLMEGPAKDSVTEIGTRLVHAFRGKNKLGATVLDSAVFVVYKTGAVNTL